MSSNGGAKKPAKPAEGDGKKPEDKKDAPDGGSAGDAAADAKPDEPAAPEDDHVELTDDGVLVHSHVHGDAAKEAEEAAAEAGTKGNGGGGAPAVPVVEEPPAGEDASKDPPASDAKKDSQATNVDAPAADNTLHPPPDPQPPRPLSPSSIPVSFSPSALRTTQQSKRPPVHHQVIFDRWYGRQGGETRGILRLREFDAGVEVEGAVCMQAFPSQGFTGLILGTHLIDSLSLPLLGVLTSPLLPPKAMISNSAPSHQLRIHGDHRVVVFAGEAKVEREEVANAVVECIVDFCKRHRIRLLLTVEGLPTTPNAQPGVLRLKESASEEEDGAKLVADLDLDARSKEKAKYLGTDPDFCARMAEEGLEQIDEGVVAGLTGGLLAEALLEPIYLACLLVPATSLFPDTGSAVRALQIIKKFVPALADLDTAPLEAKAKETEEAVVGLVRALQGGLKKEMEAPRGLYG
ncbi:hypothetical protein DFJ74DRAFT_742137 [Hyaloraphidium curvatum]|nr:hypothetical protein DFJ74DRAFT_742137 [Hyaloraphidium curvatum]